MYVCAVMYYICAVHVCMFVSVNDCKIKAPSSADKRKCPPLTVRMKEWRLTSFIQRKDSSMISSG